MDKLRLLMKFQTAFIVVHIFCASCHSQWIDPHDMNTRGKINKLKPSSSMNDIPVENNSGTTCAKEDSTHYVFYLKRLVSLIAQSSTLDKSSPSYQGHILFNINEENYNFLLNFVKSDTVELKSLRKLETILSNSLGKNLHDEYLEIFVSFHEKLYHAIFSEKTLWIFGACVMFYIVYQLFKANFSLSYIFGYLFFLVLIADFCLRYLAMLEEAEQHNANIKYSSLCDTNKMNWYEYVQFMASSRDCETKVVTPLTAYLFQVKSLIIVPLVAVGTGLGGFGKEMFVQLPWGLNLVMWPMMMLCCVIVFIFFMGFVTNTNIEFNFCHLLKLKFGGRNDGFHVTNILTGKNLNNSINDGPPHYLIRQSDNLNINPIIVRRPLENLLEAISNRPPVQIITGNSAIQEVSEPGDKILKNKDEQPVAEKPKQQHLIRKNNKVPSKIAIEKDNSKPSTTVEGKKDLNKANKEDISKRQSELFEEKFKEQTEEFCSNHVVENDIGAMKDIGGGGDNCVTSSVEEDNQNKSEFLEEIERILEQPEGSQDQKSEAI